MASGYPDVRARPHRQLGRTTFATVLIMGALLVAGSLVWSLLAGR